MNIFLCTFADSRFSPTLKRIAKEAESFKIFKRLFLFTEKDLDPCFVNKFADKLIPKVRGYGYWVWKPYVILKSLEEIEWGDILIYSDAGSHLNVKGKNKLLSYIQRLINSESGRMCNVGTLDLLEKYWTKGDLFDYFNVRNNVDVYNTPQRGAGIFMLIKTKDNISFVQKWLQVFEEEYHLVDDTPSKSSNFEGFCENRHDQSVFSILSKIYGIELISPFEVHCRDNNWKKLNDCPILFMRDKRMNIASRMRNFINRVKLKL